MTAKQDMAKMQEQIALLMTGLINAKQALDYLEHSLGTVQDAGSYVRSEKTRQWGVSEIAAALRKAKDIGTLPDIKPATDRHSETGYHYYERSE